MQPNYFKTYYKKNKAKFKARNQNRASTRKYCYAIEINDVKYCFYCKKDIHPVKIPISNIQKKDHILVKT